LIGGQSPGGRAGDKVHAGDEGVDNTPAVLKLGKAGRGARPIGCDACVSCGSTSVIAA
jgi:hypothetical protein